MTDENLWENAERQAMRDVAQTPYPGRWGYTWLGGNIDPVVEPLSRTDVEDAEGHIDPKKWALAWGDRVIRGLPPIFPSVLHVHDERCYVGTYEMISLKLAPPDHVGILDAQTGHWITTRLATRQESAAARAHPDERPADALTRYA